MTKSPTNLGVLLDASQQTPFLIDCHGDTPRHWSAADTERMADAVARGLRERGLNVGDRVAIMARNRGEYIAAYFGTMRAGLICVPVNVKLPSETVAYVLADADVKFAFVDDSASVLVPEGLATANFDDDTFDALCSPGPFEPSRPSNDVAMFLYTSGSTGKPKGVPLTHHGHLWVIERRYQANVDYASERMLVAAPLYHMNALAIVKFAAAAGATVVLLPQFSARSYIEAIPAHRCTWLTSVPTMLALVAQEQALLAQTDLSSVRSVRMGSAPVTAKLLAQVRDIFPNATVQIGYGTTEAGPVGFGPHPDKLKTPDLALGYPDAHVRVRLVDGTDRNASRGVLEIQCPAVTPGYHNLPEKTAAAMTEDGFYHTGDVMERDDDGFYFFVGRDDDMFVCNGENVFPEEVERILESHSAILQACVIPIEDDVRGQMPIAFVVREPGSDLSQDEVKQHAISHGPAYQHPRHVLFRDALPLAGTNKYDRRILAQWADEALP